MLGREVARQRRARSTSSATRPATGIETASPRMPGDLVADALREQDVGRPARRGGEREGDPAGVRAAVPRLGEQEHADARRRPARPSRRRARARPRRRAGRGTRARSPCPAAGGRRRAMKNIVRPAGHDAERRRRPSGRAGEKARRPRADEDEQQDAGPRRAAGTPRPRARRRRTGRPTRRSRAGRTASSRAPCRRRRARGRAAAGGEGRCDMPPSDTAHRPFGPRRLD